MGPLDRLAFRTDTGEYDAGRIIEQGAKVTHQHRRRQPSGRLGPWGWLGVGLVVAALLWAVLMPVWPVDRQWIPQMLAATHGLAGLLFVWIAARDRRC